ncbi:MAG: SnoaL-like domain-containing protein [Erythrobacter sp.]
MDTTQIARDFVKLLIEDYTEGYQAYWSDDIVSLEPRGGEEARCEGREALFAKHAWWDANAEMHSISLDGPYVHGDQFAIRFTMDVTMDGERIKTSEIGLYTLKDGKIVEERFFAAADDW